MRVYVPGCDCQKARDYDVALNMFVRLNQAAFEPERTAWLGGPQVRDSIRRLARAVCQRHGIPFIVVDTHVRPQLLILGRIGDYVSEDDRFALRDGRRRI